MVQRKKAFKEFIVDKFVEFKIKVDRANSLIYWFRNIIIMAASIKILFDLTLFQTFIAGATILIGLFLLGFSDVHFFHSYQREAELVTGKYNPYFAKKKFK